MKRVSKIALTSLLGLTVLAGCGGGSSSNGVPYGTSGDGEITVNLGSEPAQLATFLTSDSVSGDVLRHTIEGLVSLDAKDEAIPGVAEKWEHQGNKYVFHLRDNATWSDGTKVTAKDFEFAWDQLFKLSNGAPYAETWKVYFKGVSEMYDSQKEAKDGGKGLSFEAAKEAAVAKVGKENFGYYALDDKTFVVNFIADFPYGLNLLSFYSFAPVNKDFYEKQGGAIGESGNYAKEASKLVYNGPFVIEEWLHEDKVVMTKNPNYWDAGNIKLNKITWKMIKDSNAEVNEFENGTIDFIGLRGEAAKNYQDSGKPVQNYLDGGTWYLQYNTKHKPLSNPKVRKALTLAIDVKTFINEILMNDSKEANALTNPAIGNGEYEKVFNQTYPRPTDGNYAEVKALLEEGLKEEGMTIDQFKPVFVGDVGDFATKVNAYIQNQWKTNLGIEASIEAVEFKSRISRMHSGDFDVVLAGWSPDYNDPMSFLELFVSGGGNNHGKYANPKYDELAKQAFLEGDETKRNEVLKQMEGIIAEEMPVGPFYYRSASYITSGKLKGVERTAFRRTDLRRAYTISEAEANK